MTVKDKLVEKFGTVGMVLYFVLGIFLAFFPCLCLQFLGAAWWVIALVFAGIMLFGVVGTIALYVVWVITFPVMLNGPMDAYAILYFVAFAIFALTQGLFDLINIIMAIIGVFRK